MRRLIALAYGLATHLAFAAGVGAMAVALWGGMDVGVGPFEGPARWVADGLLALHFPLLHSFLLARRGRALLGRLAPAPARATLSTTLYAAAASLQLLLVFGLWSPPPTAGWRPEGWLLAPWACVYAASWLLLGRAMRDAGLAIQLGSLGWTALFRGRRPDYGRMPETGLFRHSRQPVYLAFALVVWTGPVWTLDHLLLAVVWSAYCYLGPRLKERRYAALFGARFAAYRARTPYFFPRPFARRRAR